MAYSFQTFSVGEVLTASKCNQIEVNVRDHQHGVSSVSSSGQVFISPSITTSLVTADATFTAFAGATTLLTIGGTGASASLFAPSTLDATSSITGAIRTSGGISAAKALWVGGLANIAGAVTMQSTLNVASLITGSISGNAATVTTNANLTGHVTSVGNAAVLGSFTYTQLNTAISNGDLGWIKVIDWTAAGAATSIAIDFSPYVGAKRIRIDLVNGAVSTDGTELFLRTTTNDGVSFDNGVADYSWAFMAYSTSPASLNSSNSSDTAIQLTSVGAGEGIDSASTSVFSGSITIENPSNATAFKILPFSFGYVLEGGAGLATIEGRGMRNAIASVDGIQIYPAAGNVSFTYAIFIED